MILGLVVAILGAVGVALLLRPWPFFLPPEESDSYHDRNVAVEFVKWVERQALARGLSVRGRRVEKRDKDYEQTDETEATHSNVKSFDERARFTQPGPAGRVVRRCGAQTNLSVEIGDKCDYNVNIH